MPISISEMASQPYRTLCAHSGRILSEKYLQKFMQLFNICTKKIIEKDGVKRIKWYKIGVMKITDNENKYMMLFQQPNTDFYIFDQDPTLPVIQAEN